METLDKRKKNTLIRSSMLNAFGLILLGLVIGYYIYPIYSEMSTQIDTINGLNSDLKRKQADGLTADEYFTLAGKYAKVNFTADDKKNKADVEAVLKKTEPGISYPEWIKKELTKKWEFDAEVEQNDKIIAGIIPTYSELSIDNSIFEKNRITLSDLISFVENDLLKQNNLTSYSPVGFSNLAFEKGQASAVNIGTYKMALEVSGQNKDLLNMIAEIQNSGKLTIQDGKLVAPKNINDQLFSNLLISIDQLSFLQTIEKPEKDNKMTINLVFYARAKSYTDLLKIRASLADSAKSLASDIKRYSELCTNLTESYCKNEATLKAIQGIRSIADDVKLLDSNLQASLKASTVQDVAAEFDKLVTTTANFTALTTTFSKNQAIIDAAQKDKTPSSN